MSDDLAGFVLACIAEDEEVAQSAAGIEVLRAEFDRDEDVAYRFVTTWTTARVLAECMAKRALVAAVQGDPFDALGAESAYEWLVLKHLAGPFADRPGFREEWRL